MLSCLFARLSGALRRRGPPGEGFSCNRPRTDRVIFLPFKYRVLLLNDGVVDETLCTRDAANYLTLLIIPVEVNVQNIWTKVH